MGKAKRAEDLGHRRHSTPPNYKAGTQVSTTHQDTLMHANPHICPCMPLWHATEVMLGSFHCGLWDLWSQHGERQDWMETRREEKKESEERQEQTNKTNLVKPSAGLGPELECVCVCVRGDVNRVAGIRTDPGLSNSQLADDPILERSAAHQPPWDPRMRACICVWVCLFVSVCAGMWIWLMCVSVCTFEGMQLYKQMCVWVCVHKYVFIGKVGLSEIKQRLSVLHVPCLKVGCDHLGHERRTEWKRGASKFQRDNQRAAFQGWSYKCLPASLLWISHSYTLTTHTNQPNMLQRVMDGSVVNNKGGQTEAGLRMNYM